MSLRLLVCFINFKKQDLVASCAFGWYNNQSVPYTSTDNTNLTSEAELSFYIRVVPIMYLHLKIQHHTEKRPSAKAALKLR